MSRIACLCGNGMSNSMVPSKSMAEIYRKMDLENAISQKMELIDLWDENQEFWYCQECWRITVVNRKSGQYVSSYSRRRQAIAVPFVEVLMWEELMFWRDQEFYDAIEENEHISVVDFIMYHPSRYLVRISPDLTLAHVFSPIDRDYLFSYFMDSKPVFTNELP